MVILGHLYLSTFGIYLYRNFVQTLFCCNSTFVNALLSLFTSSTNQMDRNHKTNIDSDECVQSISYMFQQE